MRRQSCHWVLQRGQCVQQTGIVRACLLAREGALGKVAGGGGREAVHACNQGGRHAGVQRLERGNRFMARLRGQRRRGGFARQAAIGLGLGLQPLLAFLQRGVWPALRHGLAGHEQQHEQAYQAVTCGLAALCPEPLHFCSLYKSCF